MTTTLYPGRDVPGYIRTQLQARQKVTPDMGQIRAQGNQLVFVYGTLKQGFHNHQVLNRDAQYLGKARTLRDDWLMYDTGGFPVVMRSSPIAKGNFIYGEVYSVTPDNMIRLDGLESNGSMYQREKVKFKLLDQEMESEVVKGKVTAVREAWMYVGMDDYWADESRLAEIGPTFPQTGPDKMYPTGLIYKRF